jgi:His-Xaa-Ser system radical SAM maturase HxsB
MSVPLPVRSRAITGQRVLHVSDSGEFFASGGDFLDRMLDDAATAVDRAFLLDHGHLADEGSSFQTTARLLNLAQRWSRTGELDYLILVPTLRCNLSCSYCQVSRVTDKAQGFDWSDDTLAAVLAFIDALPTDHIKIEFQGGEPTLRPDLMQAVIDRCDRFALKQFVICTNLQALDTKLWSIFDNEHLYISTSLDGTKATHASQRTGERTNGFLDNLTAVIARYGPEKVSALPTINPKAPPGIDDIIETYKGFGFESIFLRPINYQGFARKRHRYSRELDESWNAYHRAFVERIIAINWEDRTRVLEETYFSICLRRVFQPRADRHVDLRNPNPLAVDYLVIDHDGTIYPTDEARMLARSGVVDLGLGKVGGDWKGETWKLLNGHCSNAFDPACERCAYQPFCGKDVVDDLARYGTIDVDRTETAFCQKHLAIFDHIFDLIYRDDERVNYSFSRWLRMDGTAAAFGEHIA